MSSAVVSLATDATEATEATTEHERPRPQKPRGISADKCAQMLRYLLLGWDIKNIAEQCNVSQQTVYTVENNLMRYGSVRKPLYHKLGRARKLSKADETALFEYLMAEGWRQQDEMVY